MHNTLRNKNIRVFKLIFSIVLIFGISLGLYVFNQYLRIEADQSTRTNESHNQRLAFASEQLSSEVEDVDDIIKKISTSPQVQLFTETTNSRNRTALENMFYFIMKNENVYSQIRYLNEAGIEQIRVNSTQNSIERIPSTQLENKSKRPYFLYAQQLKKGEIGTWPVDIDVKNGQISKPIQSSLRIMTPVYHQSVRQGYIVVNLSVTNILNTFDEMQSENFITRIIDENGNILASDNPSEVLSHLIAGAEQYNLKNTVPILWQQILSSDEGRLTTDDKTYSYTELGLNEVYAHLGKYIVITTPTSSAYVVEQKKNLFIIASLLLLLLLGVSGYIFKLYNNHENNLMSEQLMEAAFNGVAGVIITDKHYKLIKTNQQFVRVSGFTHNELIGEPLSKLNFHLSQAEITDIEHYLQQGCWQGEIMGQNKLGDDYALMARIQVLRNGLGAVEKYVITFTDITQRKHLEEKLRKQSESDPLTGLWNRRKFDNELNSLSLFTKRYPNAQACLGIIDIDHFKNINDTYGHDIGDLALTNLAELLIVQCRETDLFARVGGEEFALLMPNTSIEHAHEVLNRLKDVIQSSNILPFTISGGIAKITGDAALAYKHADIALYSAKKAGRNLIKQFDASSSEHKAKLAIVSHQRYPNANDDMVISQ